MKNKPFLLIFLLVQVNYSCGQELLQLLNEEFKDSTTITQATFKTTRISFGQSVETRKKGILEISIFNRFWDTPNSTSQSFVADRLSTRFALEYAISDRWSTGVGATTWDRLFDGFVKYRLVYQKTGKKNMPIAITLFQNASYYSGGGDSSGPYPSYDSPNRLGFTTQALIASKITRNFSLQIAPSFIHKGNDTPNSTENYFAIGLGGRYKLGNHVSFVSEYYLVTNPTESYDTYGPFSVGVNWELGDVMLQFMLTNAVNMVEDAFITRTRNNFNFRNPNLNFGFNMSYILHFKKGLKNTSFIPKK
ncbi:DUF5777 family beta-barrel protein [Maribacter sp. CXY002]|uniref:DUF5777 family beta-barrel protein n=1 Tax=Maribacter luteocoastalis TaxID=3407671 RepID=UPI003B66ED59